MLTRRRFLTIAAAASACPAAAQVEIWRGRALGADVTLRLSGEADPTGRLWRRIERQLRRIEAQVSLFADSDLIRLNTHGHLDRPGSDTLALLRLSDALHEATAGTFDPTVQPLWQAVREGRNAGPVRALAGWHRVRFDTRRVTLERGMALTFNGVAQGLAADRLAMLLRDAGYRDVLIDAGEVQALGRAGTRDWQAAIAGPDGAPLHRVSLRDRALATSSPMGTRIGHDQPHILHPDGRPPLWRTVSVSANSAALADGLSTAFCLMTRAEIAAALVQFPEARVEFLA